MDIRIVVLLEIAVIFVKQCFTSRCDMEKGIILDDGNMGRSSDFSWLGLFIAYLKDFDEVEEAVTGIVLIKPTYALANADDIAKIPKQIFLENSQAMFIAEGDVALYCRPLSYVTHPEYETVVYSSIAVIELAIPDDSPLNPICFPEISYDSDHLYLFGYTDDNINNIWEKVIYKIRSVETNRCDRFYDKEGLIDRQHVPESYVCGRHQYSNASCIWDNGMVLASNTTGWFTFIGFSVHGPGCKVPARFIFMLHYFSWINSVTRGSDSARRADDDEEVPLHSFKTIYVTMPKYRTPSFFIKHNYIRWPNYKKQVVKMKYFNLEASYDDPHAIAIYPFDTTQEMYWKACQSSRALIYRERFELDAPDSAGVVTYKLSMYNLNIPACSCVTLTVDCTKRSEAFLTLRDEINFTPDSTGGGGNSENRSPDDLFTVVAIPEVMPPAENNDTSDEIDPMTHPKGEIEFLQGGVPTRKAISYDLYIRLEFQGSAELQFQIFGQPIVRTPTPKPSLNFYADPFTFPPDESTGTPPPGPGGPGGSGGPGKPGGPGEPGGSGGPGYGPPGQGGQSRFDNRWSGDPSILEDLKRLEMGAYGFGDRGIRPLPQGGPGNQNRLRPPPPPPPRHGYGNIRSGHEPRGSGGPGPIGPKEEQFWRISQDVVGKTVKWPSLVVDDNLEHEAMSAGQRLNLDTCLPSACCVILLTLFGMR